MGPTPKRTSRAPLRGTCLLLAHCRLLERLTSSERQPAQERLERRIGDELASVLLRGLAGDHRLRPAVPLL
jgi:hypothetical protein